jgi:hypothetical protein
MAAAIVMAGLAAGVFTGSPQAAEKSAAPAPKPMVLHFKYIPAESFMDTLHQLGNNPHVRDVLKEVPIALNEPANSVVVIGPPELAEFLGSIAKGLDQPNEYRDARMQQERQQMEAHLKFEEARQKAGLPPMQPGPGMHGRQMHGPGMGGMGMRGPQGFMGSDGPASPAPSAPASAEQPARFFQVQNAGGPPQGMGWGGMENLFSAEERDRIQQIIQRGQELRFLDDPDVRTELKVTPEQEKKFQDLKDRAQALFQAISTDVQARIKERMPTPDMTDEQRQAAIQDIRMVVADTVRGALNEVEGMVGEANGMLTEEQRNVLKVIAPQRAQTDQLTNGLAYLASTKAREEFAFTYDQSEKIKMIVRDLETEVKKARDEVAGPGNEPTAEELRSEKFAPFRAQQKEMVQKAFDRVLTILTSDQREKVQKWYDTRVARGPRGMGRGIGGRLGGGGPGGPQPGQGAPPPGAPGASPQSPPPEAPAAPPANP